MKTTKPTAPLPPFPYFALLQTTRSDLQSGSFFPRSELIVAFVARVFELYPGYEPTTSPNHE